MQSGYDYMTENPGKYDPPSQFVRAAGGGHGDDPEHIRMFGSEGKAW